MDNKKETLYTFKFTESELTELQGILDRSTIYLSDDPNINKYKKQIEKQNKKNNP